MSDKGYRWFQIELEQLSSKSNQPHHPPPS